MIEYPPSAWSVLQDSTSQNKKLKNLSTINQSLSQSKSTQPINLSKFLPQI